MPQENEKRSKSQMAEADPLSAIVSPRFAFSDRGAPATSTSVSVFLVPSGRVLYPRPTPSRPCRSLAALLIRLGSSGRRPRPIIALRGPLLPALQSPYGLTSCRLLALIDSPAPRFSVEVLRSEISCHTGVGDRTRFWCVKLPAASPNQRRICLRRHASDLSRPRAVPRPEDPKPSALIAGPAHRAA